VTSSPKNKSSTGKVAGLALVLLTGSSGTDTPKNVKAISDFIVSRGLPCLLILWNGLHKIKKKAESMNIGNRHPIPESKDLTEGASVDFPLKVKFTITYQII